MKAVRIGLVVVLLAFAAWLLCSHSKEPSPRAEADRGAWPILLASRTVDPRRLPTPSDLPRESLSVRGTCAYAVQCAAPVSATLRKRATDLGARVIAFLPRNALLVEAAPSTVRSLLATADFSAAFAYLPADKVQHGLTGGLVTIVPLAESDRGGLESFVAAEGGAVRPLGPSRQGSFRAEVSGELLLKLAARGDVRWLERYVPPKFVNDCATVDTGVREVWDLHGLTGGGQVISSADSGLDTGDSRTLHRDFADRVVGIVNLGGYTTGDYCGHGTHTAGTLAGSGEMSDGRYRGVAPDAKLFIQACGDTSGSASIHFDNAWTYDDIFAAGVTRGSYIHSDSWGSDDSGAYDDLSIGLDEVVWRCPELLVVVANGNAGSARQTVGSPATAKNALSVGNARSSRSPSNVWKISASSSRGPCADGRIKPEIAAPGTSIVSTRSSLSTDSSYDGNSSYTKMSGTSMATPHVAGCAALVRQWLAECQGFAGVLPTAALVKAVLTGGARGTVPDNSYGWGCLSLEETLFPSNRAVRLVDRIPYYDGSSLRYGVAVTNACPLDVQLCWIDCPGEASAAQALVNDLDLVVSNRTTGAVWYGNAVAGGDRTNNTESVRIPLAAAGEYDVRVVGASVPYDSSEGGAAALYIRGAFDPEEVREQVLVSLRFWSYFPGYERYYFPDVQGYAKSPLFDGECLVESNAEVSVSIPDELPWGESFDVDYYSYSAWGYRRQGRFRARLGQIEVDNADGSWYMCRDEKFRLSRTLNLKMDGTKDVVVYYYNEASTIDGFLPLWWYGRYLYSSVESGLIEESESLSSGDPDGDGFENATEFADETDPVDDESFRFAIDVFSPTGMTFTGSVKGDMIVERCDFLGGEWKGVLTNFAPRTSTATSIRLGENAATNGFYRLIYRK